MSSITFLLTIPNRKRIFADLFSNVGSFLVPQDPQLVGQQGKFVPGPQH